ncbi:MAG TPA: flagellar assembly protein FliW, partial [Spirochaetota bacterium]|nr:flagellar assembly protein FliW [Spirochaetota bacterium]
MKIKTKAFGEIEVSDKQKLYFKNGIFGFEDIQKFVLLDGGSGSPFYWLQSEEYSEIAFLIVEPKLIVSDYKLEINKDDINDL